MKQIIDAVVLDNLNRPTGEITKININNLISPPCLCGQTRAICRTINPMCNMYLCSNSISCEGNGQYQIVPKKLGIVEICKFCGDKLHIAN